MTAAGPPAPELTLPALAATKESSLVRTSGGIAIASLVSRVTGFARQLALVAVLGLGVINDSYTVANTLPLIVYELLLGGVLTSVMIPLLVRAQVDDPDGGEAYTQRLLTAASVMLVLATGVAMVAAPLLTRLYLGGEGQTNANPALATAFAYLLLPEIIFFGLGALFGAILNSRAVFGPFAWAPVVNNLVMLIVLAVYALTPGEISLDPVRMGDPKLLVLGLGTTAGIVIQAAVLLPALRRVGFRWRLRWGWDRRLTEAGGLALWVIGYVLIGQVGYIVTTRVAAAADPGSVSTYATAWLLLQVPYGVFGVSLLTALMPRMSRAAALGDDQEVVADLSRGTRLSVVALIPVSVLLTLFGTALGVALFAHGRTGEADAARLGLTVAVSAFGLLPFAMVMLQLRVFYAMKDGRTPTVIQVIIVAVKVPLLLACPLLLPPEQVVLGLAAANSASFVIGAGIGQWWLRNRLGSVRTRAALRTIGLTTLASLLAGMIAFAVVVFMQLSVLRELDPVLRAWVILAVGALLGGALTVVLLRVLRVAEIEPMWRWVTRRRRQRSPFRATRRR